MGIGSQETFHVNGAYKGKFGAPASGVTSANTMPGSAGTTTQIQYQTANVVEREGRDVAA